MFGTRILKNFWINMQSRHINLESGIVVRKLTPRFARKLIVVD